MLFAYLETNQNQDLWRGERRCVHIAGFLKRITMIHNVCSTESIGLTRIDQAILAVTHPAYRV